MDDRDCILDHGLAPGDSIPWRAVDQAADVHGVDGRDVADRLGYFARIAGARVFRMGDARRLTHATVRTRSDAAPIDSAEGIALGKAKVEQEC